MNMMILRILLKGPHVVEAIVTKEAGLNLIDQHSKHVLKGIIGSEDPSGGWCVNVTDIVGMRLLPMPQGAQVVGTQPHIVGRSDIVGRSGIS